MLDMVRNPSLLQRRRMKRTSKWRLMMRYWSQSFFIMKLSAPGFKPCWSCLTYPRCGQLLGTQPEPSFRPWRGNACWRLQVWLILQAVERVSPTSKCPTSPLNRRSDCLKQKSATSCSASFKCRWWKLRSCAFFSGWQRATACQEDGDRDRCWPEETLTEECQAAAAQVWCSRGRGKTVVMCKHMKLM